MGLYKELKYHHKNGDTGTLGALLTELRAVDPLFDKICAGEASFSTAAAKVDSKFSSYFQTKKEPVLDPQFNEMVRYLCDNAELSGDNDIGDINFLMSGLDKKALSQTKNKDTAKRIGSSAIGTTTGLVILGGASILYPPLLPVAAQVGAFTFMYSTLFDIGSNTVKRIRKKLISELKSRAGEMDAIVATVYGDEWKERAPKKESTGESLVDVVLKNSK